MYTSILNVAFSRFLKNCCSSKYVKNLYKLFHQRRAGLECDLNFNGVTGTANGIIKFFSNNQFINRIFGGTLDLPDRKDTECCLKHITILKKIKKTLNSASLTMDNFEIAFSL